VRRTVETEWLDQLPPADPAAEQSRRDLRWINRRLGASTWFAQQLAAHAHPAEPMLEIGAGDGSLTRALREAGHDVTALDRVPPPNEWRTAWHVCDVFQFTQWRAYPVVLANLFLHHFTFEQLAALGAHLRPHARVLLFSEPARRRRYQWLFALACRIERAHPVTRHDGHVSIAAGFLREELPHALGLTPAEWQWHIHVTALGMYRMVALRR
jgi:2-polyprenyl-3-methyl-5-hydroxy-6-metoxy-1,4-benzoquinol methylase